MQWILNASHHGLVLTSNPQNNFPLRTHIPPRPTEDYRPRRFANINPDRKKLEPRNVPRLQKQVAASPQLSLSCHYILWMKLIWTLTTISPYVSWLYRGIVRLRWDRVYGFWSYTDLSIVRTVTINRLSTDRLKNRSISGWRLRKDNSPEVEMWLISSRDYGLVGRRCEEFLVHI